MKALIDVGIITVTLAMMLAVGLDLQVRTLLGLFRRKSRVGALLALHLFVPPLVGIALFLLLDLPPELVAPLLLLAACPIGDIANLYVVFARGNPALSLMLNATTCLIAPLSMVGVFALLRQLGFEHTLLAVPATTVFGRLVVFLILPVCLGALLTWKHPGLSRWIRPWLHRFAAVGIILMLAVILANQWEIVQRDGPRLALTCLAYMLTCLAAGLVIHRFLVLPPADSLTSLLCLPVRNVGVASLIAITLLDQVEYASVAAVYFLAEVPLLLLLVLFLRRPGLARNSARSASFLS